MADKPSIWGRIDGTGVPLALARLGVGAMFVYLAVQKLLDPPHLFRKAVATYQVLPLNPPEIINTVAMVLPWIELTCGVLLLSGLFVRGAFILTAAMLAVFTPAIYQIAIEKLNSGEFARFCDVNFDCGCGTGTEWMCTKIPMNLALLAGSIVGMFCTSRRWCLSSRLLRRSAGRAAMRSASAATGGAAQPTSS